MPVSPTGSDIPSESLGRRVAMAPSKKRSAPDCRRDRLRLPRLTCRTGRASPPDRGSIAMSQIAAWLPSLEYVVVRAAPPLSDRAAFATRGRPLQRVLATPGQHRELRALASHLAGDRRSIRPRDSQRLDNRRVRGRTSRRRRAMRRVLSGARSRSKLSVGTDFQMAFQVELFVVGSRAMQSLVRRQGLRRDPSARRAAA